MKRLFCLIDPALIVSEPVRSVTGDGEFQVLLSVDTKLELSK